MRFDSKYLLLLTDHKFIIFTYLFTFGQIFVTCATFSLTHGVYGIGANDVRRPWFCCFVMAQRVILGAMGPKRGQ